MAVKKTLLKLDTGVCLHKVDEVIGTRIAATHFRLSTLRPAQPRLIADQSVAEAAFIAEVAASKRDPIAVHMAHSG